MSPNDDILKLEERVSKFEDWLRFVSIWVLALNLVIVLFLGYLIKFYHFK